MSLTAAALGSSGGRRVPDGRRDSAAAPGGASDRPKLAERRQAVLREGRQAGQSAPLRLRRVHPPGIGSAGSKADPEHLGRPPDPGSPARRGEIAPRCLNRRGASAPAAGTPGRSSAPTPARSPDPAPGGDPRRSDSRAGGWFAGSRYRVTGSSGDHLSDGRDGGRRLATSKSRGRADPQALQPAKSDEPGKPGNWQRVGDGRSPALQAAKTAGWVDADKSRAR